MPIKLTANQIRPSIDVEWYSSEMANGGKIPGASLFDSPHYLESSEEVSVDGLTLTRIFVMDDGFSLEEFDSSDIRIQTIAKLRKYERENGIIHALNIEII